MTAREWADMMQPGGLALALELAQAQLGEALRRNLPSARLRAYHDAVSRWEAALSAAGGGVGCNPTEGGDRRASATSGRSASISDPRGSMPQHDAPAAASWRQNDCDAGDDASLFAAYLDACSPRAAVALPDNNAKPVSNWDCARDLFEPPADRLEGVSTDAVNYVGTDKSWGQALNCDKETAQSLRGGN